MNRELAIEKLEDVKENHWDMPDEEIVFSLNEIIEFLKEEDGQ